MSPNDVWQEFSKIKPGFTPYRDAGYSGSTYQLTLLDCWRGLLHGIKLGHFSMKNFDLLSYEHYEKVQNGDLNWIIPNKIIAFSTPNIGISTKKTKLFSAEDYVPLFKEFGVELVIRLNNPLYNSSVFIKNGIKHLDLFFQDGSNPPNHIIDDFLKAVEGTKGAVAVHCKAGLGRTGTLIAMYAMKHYRFKASDFIGWIRLLRPGSILGPQQYFVNEKEKEMIDQSKESQVWNFSSNEYKNFVKSMQKSFPKTEIKENLDSRTIGEKGEQGQGEYLLRNKLKY